MSSFYGISPNQKPFVFDRIYGNYTSALAAASAENGDGVYPGRYILIEYDSPFSDNALKNIYQRIDKNEYGQDVKKQEFLSLKIIQEIEKQTTIEEKNEEDTIIAKYKELLIETTENNNIITKIIARQSSTDENNLDNFNKIIIFKITIETGKEQEEKEIGTYIKQSNIIIPDGIENNYDKNRWVDENYSPISDRKNYDSTVWMKKANSSNNINPKLEDFYINVAELNSPSLELSEVDLGFPKDEEGNILPLDRNRTPIIEATDAITLNKENSEDEGKLTQNLTVQIQSIGKAISDIYDLLYGYDDNGETRTIPASYTYKSVAALLQSSGIKFPGTITGDPYLGYSKDNNDESKDGKLIHINNNRATTVITTINKNIINLTETTDNKIKYTLQTITTDDLGHIIDIDTATKTTTIDLSIGAVPESDAITTSIQTIWGNIGYTNSTDNTLWGKVSLIDSSVTSINNIIGSSTITNTTPTNLWGNIHNITTNIIGSSTTTDAGTLWDNIHRIDNIIGSSSITDTLWQNIQEIWDTGINSITTIQNKISSIETDVTSISNNIGSSSDPTNTTTVWSNIERIDKKIPYQTELFNFEEEQYVPGYLFTHYDYYNSYISTSVTTPSWTPAGYEQTRLLDILNLSTPTTTEDINNWNTKFKIISNNNTIGLPDVNSFTTYFVNYNDVVYQKNRTYKINYKSYDDGTLECDGEIDNIIINFTEQREEFTNSGSFYTSLIEDDSVKLMYMGYKSSSTNTYGGRDVTFMYPINLNKYKFLPDETSENPINERYKFIEAPVITTTVIGGMKSIIEQDQFYPVNIHKEYFSGCWSTNEIKTLLDGTANSTDPYKLSNQKECKILVTRAKNCADDGTTSSALSSYFDKGTSISKMKYKGNNDFAKLSFHAVGRWKAKETS